MQHTVRSISPRPASGEAIPQCNIVIAYEDFETGKLAKETYDFLVKNLGQCCQLSNQIWKFEVLSIPKLRELAVQDAKAADIAIVSSHGGELPLEVKGWIENWLEADPRPMALVCIEDRAVRNSSCQARAYLAEVAKRGAMEFFAPPDEFSCQGNDPKLDAQTASNLAVAIDSEHYANSEPRWGINE